MQYHTFSCLMYVVIFIFSFVFLHKLQLKSFFYLLRLILLTHDLQRMHRGFCREGSRGRKSISKICADIEIDESDDVEKS